MIIASAPNFPTSASHQHHGQDNSHQYGGENMDDPPCAATAFRGAYWVRFTRGGVLRSLDVLSLTHPRPPFHGFAQKRPARVTPYVLF